MLTDHYISRMRLDLSGFNGVRDTKAQRKQGERSQLVYLEREQDDQEEEKGKETGEGLNRPTTIRKQTAWTCKPETCRAINDERMHGQTAESSSRVITSPTGPRPKTSKTIS
jgi:hypothetical protein